MVSADGVGVFVVCKFVECFPIVVPDKDVSLFVDFAGVDCSLLIEL